MSTETIDQRLRELAAKPLDPAARAPGRAAVDAAARKLRCAFPDDLRHVLETRGPLRFAQGAIVPLPPGCPIGPHFSVDVWYGLGSRPSRDPVELALDTYEGRLPEGSVPLAADPGGNLLLVWCPPRMPPAVLAWDHENRHFTEEQVIAAVRDLRTRGVEVEDYDIGQLLSMWELGAPPSRERPWALGNCYRCADSVTSLLDALRPHPDYANG